MKKILIILVVLLLLAGAGGAAWWFYFRKDPNAPPPPPPAPQLSQLTIPIRSDDSMTVSVIKDGQVQRAFFFRFALTFDDPKKADKAKQVMPELVNDFQVELHTLLARKLVEDSKYNLDLLQDQLQKVCDRRLGPGIVYKVSITNMEQAEGSQ
jgi:flagellar basal body-associated protein FliL